MRFGSYLIVHPFESEARISRSLFPSANSFLKYTKENLLDFILYNLLCIFFCKRNIFSIYFYSIFSTYVWMNESKILYGFNSIYFYII